MSSRTLLFRSALLAVLLILAMPAVSAWTLQNWSVKPAGGTALSPGTPVSAGYSIHFDSWMTGSTFDKDNTLVMYTDLAGPQWVVSRIELMDDQPPVVEQMPVRQSSQVRLDGWSLSYARKRFDLFVQLSGTVPSLNQSGTISIVKLQEVSPGAKVVSGTILRKEAFVSVPTPEPVVAPVSVTINMTPAEIIEITPGPVVAGTRATPAKKVTYSPGPEPVLVTGMLAGLVLIMRSARRR
jgi:hypothetical protein